MITVEVINEDYLSVRQEYLKLPEAEKKRLYHSFVTHICEAKDFNEFDVENADIFFIDHPEKFLFLCDMISEHETLADLAGCCERFFLQVGHKKEAAKFIPHASFFEEIASAHGYRVKTWCVSQFFLEKGEEAYSVSFAIEPHVMTINILARESFISEEVKKVIHSFKEMMIEQNERDPRHRLLFATGAYNVEVAISDVNK